MNTNFYFGTPVYTSIIQDHDELECIQAEIKEAISKADKNNINMDNPWDDTVLTSFSYDDQKNFNCNQFIKDTPLFKQYILKNVHQFFPNAQNIDIFESWFNISRKGGFQHFHCHPESHISGVYYFQTNGNDGNIKFECNSSALKNSIFRQNCIEIPPEVGKIILFPSFLDHAVMMNTTNDQRISITFNINVM